MFHLFKTEKITSPYLNLILLLIVSKNEEKRKPLVDLDTMFNALKKRKHDLLTNPDYMISVSEKSLV